MTDIPAGWSGDFGLAPRDAPILAQVRPVKGVAHAPELGLTWDDGGEGDDFDQSRVGWAQADGSPGRFKDGDLLCWRRP